MSENDEFNIPVDLKDNFDQFEDTERTDDPIVFQSPEDVVKSTSEKSTQVAGISDLPEEVDESLVLQSGFDEFLDNANITRKQFYIFLLTALFLIVGVIVSFYFLFKYFGSAEEQVRVVQVVNIPEEEQVQKKEGFLSKLALKFKKDDVETEAETVVTKNEVETKEDVQSVESSQSLPTDEKIVLDSSSNSLESVVKIGQAVIKENRLSYYLRTYRQIRNIYNIDLFVYLSTVPDRLEGFNLYVIQLKGAYEEFKLAYEDLRQEIAELQLRVDKLKESSKELETKFFDSLDKYESEFIQDRLNSFQDVSRRRDFAITELKARQSVVQIYAKAEKLIETKIKAIELNKDAFVKGVKVVNYENIDLDLIIREK